MYCIHCGKEIADGSQFCGFCGKSQSADAPINSMAAGPTVPPETKQQSNKNRLPLVVGMIAVIAIVVIGIVAVAGGRIESENSYVLSVKNGTPVAYPDKTYGTAFENFFGSPKWRYFKGEKEGPDEDGDGEPDYTEDNVDIVEFTGRCTYQNVDVNALIQFTLSQDDDTFEATYLSFNEVPQSMLMLYGLLDKVFGEAPASDAGGSETKQGDATQNSVKQETNVDSVSIAGSWIDKEYYYYMDVSRDGSLYSFDVSYTQGGAFLNWSFSGTYTPPEGATNVTAGEVKYSDGVFEYTTTGPDGQGGISYNTERQTGQKGTITIVDDSLLLWYPIDDSVPSPVSFTRKEENTELATGSEYNYTDSIASGGPLDDFVIKGYTYSEAVAQGWGDEFEAIANSMGSDGESPVARFYWFIDDCDKTYFTRSDLEGFDKDMAMLARNAIYAHEGRKFTNTTVKEFFESCAWYFGYIEPDSFQDSMLNDYESSNKELIVAYEKEMGYK